MCIITTVSIRILIIIPGKGLRGKERMNELELRSMDFNESWNTFKTEVQDSTKEYRLARFGININFDINDYLKGRVLIKSKTGKAFVRGRAFDLEDFETELEKRERIIKEWLITNFCDVEVATPRGLEYNTTEGQNGTY